ncbi:hypothetical protein GQ43DRAFT_80875 [Delitschia confertaspora ATCC 74209]|uniref:Uncharacterized protein n=1 Tax=Delitschia confertaspora ATCC 74209 TaxID=1513339 RepID=A0A9P4MUM2_9PLEO|nr:hypothetical protein GQ43DRAFT_80875 [Delitschia confertaspora ATCC 74209]
MLLAMEANDHVAGVPPGRARAVRLWLSVYGCPLMPAPVLLIRCKVEVVENPSPKKSLSLTTAACLMFNSDLLSEHTGDILLNRLLPQTCPCASTQHVLNTTSPLLPMVVWRDEATSLSPRIKKQSRSSFFPYPRANLILAPSHPIFPFLFPFLFLFLFFFLLLLSLPLPLPLPLPLLPFLLLLLLFFFFPSPPSSCTLELTSHRLSASSPSPDDHHILPAGLMVQILRCSVPSSRSGRLVADMLRQHKLQTQSSQRIPCLAFCSACEPR